MTTKFIPKCALAHLIIAGNVSYDEVYKSEENDRFSAALNSALIPAATSYNSRNRLSSGIIVSTMRVRYYQDNKKHIRTHACSTIAFLR